MAETATATNSTEANASSEAPAATLLATASSGTGTEQQTQTTQTQPPPAPETAAKKTTTTGTTAASTAPESYTFTAPEGTEYDPEVLGAYAGAAKEAGLTQDAAQKLIEKMAPALAARQVDQVQAIHKEWLDASTADKEFGGEKLPENLGVARKTLEKFGSPELRALLDETGLGNHPEVIRFFYRAGKAISEDKFVGGNVGNTARANPASVLYDKTAAK
ncbi:MAG TPA: hypothetical protein VGR47_05985 [Terracidiphilus sp.]|nr:hypothetical protein [Terracidiphilus sp.]